jgi:transcriptional regulator with XRE-family HTH domain
LGTYLRLERRRVGWETADVAMKLGLSDTYYRLVESGGAPLNQSLVFKLLEFLGARGAVLTIAPTRIHLQRLALFLVGSHWVGAEMAALDGKPGSDLQAMEMLADQDADFYFFHQRTRRYYALPEPELKQFLIEDAAPQVAAFLGNRDYARPTKETKDQLEEVLPPHVVLAMPTMNVEMVRRLIADLSGRPFVHTPLLAAKWESRMAPTFTNVRGLYVRKDMIISPANLGTFLYWYLFERSCREVRFLFLESPPRDKSKKEFSQLLKREFISGLNDSRRTEGLELVSRDAENKLQIACVSIDELQRLKLQFLELRRRNNLDEQTAPYDAYWSFDTTADVPIGFVGIKGTTSKDIWNISLEESLTKRDLFDKLWSEVGVDQK